MILYCSFALFIAIMVVKASSLHLDLVDENYYDAEMKYQQRIEQSRKSNALHVPVTIKYVASDAHINIDFPDLNATITGSALLFRPSDAKQDKLMQLNIKPNTDFYIATTNLEKGLWRLEVEWNAKGETYYNEQVLYIP